VRHCFELSDEQVALLVATFEGRFLFQSDASSLVELITSRLLTVGLRGLELTDLGQLVARKLGAQTTLQDVSVLGVAVYVN
jgi:hypothetical protein